MGGQVICWFDVCVQGQVVYVGIMLMCFWCDVMFMVVEMVVLLEMLVEMFVLYGLVIIGEFGIFNVLCNIIVVDLIFMVDLCYYEDVCIVEMELMLWECFVDIVECCGLIVQIDQYWGSLVMLFDFVCVKVVVDVVEVFDYWYQCIVSGVGYDVIYIVKYCLMVMIFILCVNGLSYNEVEDVLFEDVMCGVDVLLYVMLVWVQRVSQWDSVLFDLLVGLNCCNLLWQYCVCW